MAATPTVTVGSPVFIFRWWRLVTKLKSWRWPSKVYGGHPIRISYPFTPMNGVGKGSGSHSWQINLRRHVRLVTNTTESHMRVPCDDQLERPVRVDAVSMTLVSLATVE